MPPPPVPNKQAAAAADDLSSSSCMLCLAQVPPDTLVTFTHPTHTSICAASKMCADCIGDLYANSSLRTPTGCLVCGPTALMPTLPHLPTVGTMDQLPDPDRGAVALKDAGLQGTDAAIAAAAGAAHEVARTTCNEFRHAIRAYPKARNAWKKFKQPRPGFTTAAGLKRAVRPSTGRKRVEVLRAAVNTEALLRNRMNDALAQGGFSASF